MPTAVRVHAQDVFAGVDGSGVLVHLGSAGAADEVDDLAFRVSSPTSASKGTSRRWIPAV